LIWRGCAQAPKDHPPSMLMQPSFLNFISLNNLLKNLTHKKKIHFNKKNSQNFISSSLKKEASSSSKKTKIISIFPLISYLKLFIFITREKLLSQDVELNEVELLCQCYEIREENIRKLHHQHFDENFFLFLLILFSLCVML